MNPTLLNRKAMNYCLTDSELAAGLRKTLDRKYASLREAARRSYERAFGVSDPSDACVSVRISGAKQPHQLQGRYRYLSA